LALTDQPLLPGLIWQSIDLQTSFYKDD